MFCVQCGTEIDEKEIAFCPNCGLKIGSAPEQKNTIETKSIEPTQVTGMVETAKKQKKKMRKGIKFIIAVAIISILAAMGVAAYNSAERKMVQSTTEQIFEVIKEGPSEETIQVYMELILQELDMPTLTNIISNNVSGSDIKDFYEVFTYYMYYEVLDVQKVERGHYQVTMYVENVNMLWATKTVITDWSNTLGLAVGEITDYFGLTDNDTSHNVATSILEVASQGYNTKDADYFVYGTYTVDIMQEDGAWIPSSDDSFMTILKNCFGVEGNFVITEKQEE